MVAVFFSPLSYQLTILLPSAIQPPHTVLLFIAGFLLASFSSAYVPDSQFGQSILAVQEWDPHILFLVFLPPLLYEDAADGKWHVMVRVFPSAVWLAGPGVLFTAVSTAAFLFYCCPSAAYSWEYALLEGSILAATDPVAVISALKSLKAPEKLGDIIKGESLLNDGTAVVLFHVFRRAATVPGGLSTVTWQFFTGMLFQMAVLGAGLGLAFGVLLSGVLRITHKANVEMMVLIGVVYAAYFVAEHPMVQYSGVLSVVFLGFFVAGEGRYAMIENEHHFHAVFGFIAHFCNELIFLIAGVVGEKYVPAVGRVTNDILSGSDFVEALTIYVAIHVIRATCLLLSFPILKRLGYGLSWKEATVMWYGGLRGAVGLAMALMLQGPHGVPDESAQVKIGFHVSIIVLLTLIINGTTMMQVYKRLKVYPVVKHHSHLLLRALDRMERATCAQVRAMREHWLFSNCYFDIISLFIPSFTGLNPEITLQDDGHGSHKIKISPKGLDTGVKYMVAMSVERDHTDRLLQKLRYQAQWVGGSGSKGNIFIVHDATADVGDEDLGEFAGMHGFEPIIEDESSPKSPTSRKTKTLLERQARTAEVLKQAGHNVPFIRWRLAVQEVIATQRLIHSVKQRTQTHRREKLIRYRKEEDTCMGTSWSAYRKTREVMEDEETLAELYQAILNALSAQLDRMFEIGMMSEMTLRILEVAIQHAETAVEGKLEAEDFLVENGDPAFRELHTKDHREQMQMSIYVAVEYIRHRLGSVHISGLGFKWWFVEMLNLGKFDRRLQLKLEWLLYKRDFELIVFFLIAFEHILEDLDVLLDFEEIKDTLEQLCAYVKQEIMPSIQRRSRRFFWFMEHLTAARRVLVGKMQTLRYYAEEGTMNRDDAEHVIKHAVLKRLKTLDEFVPDSLLLDKMALRRKITAGSDYISLVTDERENQKHLVKSERQSIVKKWAGKKQPRLTREPTKYIEKLTERLSASNKRPSIRGRQLMPDEDCDDDDMDTLRLPGEVPVAVKPPPPVTEPDGFFQTEEIDRFDPTTVIAK
jgi:NhaP-type Na+/H+ or K+/H+ antiporter